MIIWLNGAFGVGKTQTAFELHSRIPNSFVFDPEQIVFFSAKLYRQTFGSVTFKIIDYGGNLPIRGYDMSLRISQES